MKKRILFGVLLGFTLVAFGQEPEINPGEAQGKKVGNFVKGLVDTAIPIWGTISELIWPNGQGNRKSKQQADAIVESNSDNKKEIEDEIKSKLLQSAKQKISPIRNLSSEMSLVYRFSEPLVFADRDLGDLMVELNKETVDWQLARTKFGLAKADLNRLDQIQESEINEKIKESLLRTTFKLIKSTKAESIVNLDLFLSDQRKEKDNAIKETERLRSELEKMDYLMSGYLFEMYRDIKDLTEWLDGAMGVNEEIPNKMYNELDALNKSRL